MQEIHAIIPARFASTRFHAKPLAMINGKTMLQRVYLQALGANCFKTITVATDHISIIEHCNEKKIPVVNTSTTHINGTLRVHEASQILKFKPNDIVVNIQGDEPFINIQSLRNFCEFILQHNSESIYSMYKKINSISEYNNTNTVKVVLTKSGNAMYFSRSPIPFFREEINAESIVNKSVFKHIGIYAFRIDMLNKLIQNSETRLQEYESLEQLNWLENEYKIKMLETQFETFAVDAPNDLQHILELLQLGVLKDEN
jgi:3-deoxy-manno-octulosonate cytidylyltransferase (CMP-KDO synthetase)